MCNVLVLFADGVVVWRMNVLCGTHFSRKILRIPSIMLSATLREYLIVVFGRLENFSALAPVTVLATVGLRVYITCLPGNGFPAGPFELVMNVLQVASQVFSFVANIVTTSIIGTWAWYACNLAPSLAILRPLMAPLST